MTDTIFEPLPSSMPAHRIFTEGIIYCVNYFFENEHGDGGSFTVIGMSHDTPQPPEWTLETIATGFKQRISISNLEDASDINLSDTSETSKTSCNFSYL